MYIMQQICGCLGWYVRAEVQSIVCESRWATRVSRTKETIQSENEIMASTGEPRRLCRRRPVLLVPLPGLPLCFVLIFNCKSNSTRYTYRSFFKPKEPPHTQRLSDLRVVAINHRFKESITVHHEQSHSDVLR